MPGLTSSSTNTTSSSNSSSNTSGNTSSSSTPTFGGLQGLMNQLSGYASNSITNPTQQLQPIESAGLDSINQEYNNIPQQVSTQLAARGYGSSGLTGSALTGVAEQKAATQSQFQGQLASDAIQQSQFGASLANQLLNTDKGVSSTGSYSGESTGSQNSNSTTTSTPSILSTISGLASLVLSGGTSGLFGGGGGGGAMGGDLTGYQTNGSGIYTGSQSNPILIPGYGGLNVQP